jgi:hypothetical protein
VNVYNGGMMDNIRTKPSTREYRHGWDAIFAKQEPVEITMEEAFNDLREELGKPRALDIEGKDVQK